MAHFKVRMLETGNPKSEIRNPKSEIQKGINVGAFLAYDFGFLILRLQELRAMPA